MEKDKLIHAISWPVGYFIVYGLLTVIGNFFFSDGFLVIYGLTGGIAARLSKREKPHVGIKTRFIFNMMRMMQKSGWGSSPVEKEYWEQNGWLEKKRPWGKL